MRVDRRSSGGTFVSSTTWIGTDSAGFVSYPLANRLVMVDSSILFASPPRLATQSQKSFVTLLMCSSCKQSEDSQRLLFALFTIFHTEAATAIESVRVIVTYAVGAILWSNRHTLTRSLFRWSHVLGRSNKSGQMQKLTNDNYCDVKLYSIFHTEYKDIEFITIKKEPKNTSPICH